MYTERTINGVFLTISFKENTKRPNIISGAWFDIVAYSNYEVTFVIFCIILKLTWSIKRYSAAINTTSAYSFMFFFVEL